MMQTKQWQIAFTEHYAPYMVVLLILLCMASLPFVTDLRLSNDFRVYFSQDNPELSAYEAFEDDFASHDSIVIMADLKNPEDSWLLPKHHQLIQEMEDAFWQLPTIHRVNSISNYQYTQASDDEIRVTPLLELLKASIAEQSRFKSDIEQEVLSLFSADPQLDDVYLSSDQELVAIQADLFLDKSSPTQARDVYDAANKLRNEWQARHPEIDFYLIGSVASNVTLEDAVANDLLLLVPLTYIVIVIGLWFFLRSVKATVFTLIVVTLSIIFTFSLFAIFKQELTPVAGFVPTVVLTLAVADCVHYLTSYRYLITVEGYSAKDANREAFNINWLPISITSITTAIGVLFLNLSDSPPYQDLGNMVAIGVVLAWLLTLLLLPILLRKYPINYVHLGVDRTVAIKQELLGRYSIWLRRNRHTVSLSLVVILMLSAYGLSRIYFSENWSKYFSEKFEVTRAINLIEDKFNRLHRYELVLRSEQDNGVNDLEYLRVKDQFVAFLEQHEKVQLIQSYAYILKRLNQTMNNDNPEAFRMPDSQPMAAQYLLLYELSLPQGMGIENFVSFDKSASRTSLLLTPSESHELLDFEREVVAYFEQIPQSGPTITLEVSGLDHIFSHIAERNITQMLVGTSIALVIISLILMAIFKSVKYGVISLIPNLIPAFIAYGIWGVTAGYIDLALSVVICMSLGIVVDDSVHFLSKYIRARQQLGLNTPDSVDYSFHIVGKALVTTTVILVAGFATMMFSPLSPTVATGMLLCITLITALIVDFTLLPIVLNKFDDEQPSQAAPTKGS